MACREAKSDGRATSEASSDCIDTQQAHVDLLYQFDLHGWKPNSSLSDDENYMEMVMLITRSSKCRQGSMACLLVRPSSNNDFLLTRRVIGASINQPLFTKTDSDVHAEIGALGQAASRGNATHGCTAYITMPPCKKCFGALVVSGIAKIATRMSLPAVLTKACQERDIETVQVSVDMDRINSLVKATRTHQDESEIVQQRKRRKEERKQVVEAAQKRPQI